MKYPSIPVQVTGQLKPSLPGLQAFRLAYSDFVYRCRWYLIALWSIGLLVSVPFAHLLPTLLRNSGYTISNSESQQVTTTMTTTLHQPATQMLVVLHSAHTLVSDPSYQQEVQTLVARAKTFKHVIGVAQGGTGQDGRTTFLAVGFDLNQDVIGQQLPDVRRALLPDGHVSGPAQVQLTGDPVVANEIQLDTQADVETAEMIALPLTLLVLLIVFGSVVAALLPLLLAAVAVPTALAMIHVVASHVETNIFVLNIASILGLGLSIDYSLLMSRRFREEIARGREVREAVALTIATAGEAVLFSGLCVMIGFTSLLLINIPVTNSFALGGLAVACTAVAAALTLLPALLSVFGARVNALRIPLLQRVQRSEKITRHLSDMPGQRAGDEHASGFWHRWAMTVMKRPVSMIVLTATLLLLLGLPALSLNPGLPAASALPGQSEARQGLEVLSEAFPDISNDPIYVTVQTQDGSPMLTAQHLEQLRALSQHLAEPRHITVLTSLTNLPQTPETARLTQPQLSQLYLTGAYERLPLLAQFVAATTIRNTTLITLKANVLPDSSSGETLIDQLRTIAHQSGNGLVVQVGGASASSLDFDRVLYSSFLRTLLFIFVATYILLLWMLRSIFLPLKAIVMNVLSITASFGALVFVFQQGHLTQTLNFTSNGIIDRFVPILLFCTLFGLSMDYEVFLLLRMREEWEATHANRVAVARGLEHTGGVITNAALLFAIVSGAFIFTSLIVTKELGLGITLAVLVDASIIRTILVPAGMQVMGRWNWWFPGQKRKSV